MTILTVWAERRLIPAGQQPDTLIQYSGRLGIAAAAAEASVSVSRYFN